MSIEGRGWKFGDDVNTDVIFPGKYIYSIVSPKEMAKHAMEGINPRFASAVQENDMIVAGKNFGCGSSREQAATCLKYSKVGAVVAGSFGRIFFRNAINIGLPLVQCPEAVDVIEDGERIQVDYVNGTLFCQGGRYEFAPLPDFVLEIMLDGGLIPHTKKKLKKEKAGSYDPGQSD